LPLKANIAQDGRDVRFVRIADMARQAAPCRTRLMHPIREMQPIGDAPAAQ
jgi:hypothetical protein